MSPAVTNATITLTSEVENVMSTLVDILDRESEAVRVSNFASFREIQNDKFSMLSRYRSLMETLQRQTDSLSKVDPKVIERLRASSEKFKVSAKRNTLALESGRNSMQRIVDRIVRCARDTIHGDRQSYNKKGQARTNTQLPLSVQVNEVL
jgi:PP-loop superfamily ATP-utilizing enzyme